VAVAVGRNAPATLLAPATAAAAAATYRHPHRQRRHRLRPRSAMFARRLSPSRTKSAPVPGCRESMHGLSFPLVAPSCRELLWRDSGRYLDILSLSFSLSLSLSIVCLRKIGSLESSA